MGTPAQNKVIGFAAVAAVVVAGAGFFVGISPQLGARAEAKSNIAATQAGVQALDLKLADLKAKEAGLTEVLADVERLSAQFPSDLEQNAWITMVVAAGNRAGVTVTGIDPTTPAAPGTLDEQGNPIEVPPTEPVPADQVQGNIHDDPNALPPGEVATATDGFPIAEVRVSITAVGSTGGLARFMSNLASMQRPLLIDSVSIAAGEGGGLRLSLTGISYLTRPLNTDVKKDETDAAPAQ